jgi:hypothetical protein
LREQRLTGDLVRELFRQIRPALEETGDPATVRRSICGLACGDTGATASVRRLRAAFGAL